MKTLWRLGAVAILSILPSCSRGVVGGNPTAARSTGKGTSRTYIANEAEVMSAVTNAFGSPWLLESAADVRYRLPLWDAARGLLLLSIDQTIAKVELDDPAHTRVPYIAYFNIIADTTGPEKTKVTVRTIKSEVIDGTEFGAHGGLAQHHRSVAPIRQEEEKIFTEIEKNLRHNGRLGVKRSE